MDKPFRRLVLTEDNRMDFENNPVPQPDPALARLLSIREVVIETWQREVRARMQGLPGPNGPAMARRIHSLFDEIAHALFGAPSPADEGGAPSAAVAASRPNVSPFDEGHTGVREARVGADQIAHEFHVFKDTLAACAGSSWLDLTRWRAVERIVDAATREALKTFSDVEEDARRHAAAALSHDMRTPLAIIASGAQLISLAPSLDVARNAALKIDANAARLSDMIADLLDALTLQSGAKLALKLSLFDAYELANEVRDQYLESGAGAVAFEAEGASTVGYWCRDALRRALENLVNNAIKYGDGGLVHIGAKEANGRLLLSVRNTGAPIPMDMRQSIFEYFMRDKSVASTTGWGVGLPFVKAVAESHGGDVSLDSTSERGTAFLLELPLDCRPFVDASKAST